MHKHHIVLTVTKGMVLLEVGGQAANGLIPAPARGKAAAP